MTLESTIRAIPDWQSKTSQEILDLLQVEDIPYLNNEDFTWKGIASVWIPESNKRFGREGNKLLQDILLQQGETWLVNQLAVGIALTDDEIQATFEALDASGLVPGARHIAREVKRNISLLESNKLPVPSPQELSDLLSEMKLEDWKKAEEEQAWDRMQAFKVALTAYDGTGPKPEL